VSYYAGIDVSLEQSSVCVVDGDGRIVREGKVGQAKSVRLKEKIAAHEVTSVGNDRAELSKMAGQAREADGHDGLTVIADRGYFKGEEILACEIWHDAALPKPAPSGRVSGKGLTSSFRGRGREGPESALLGHSASHSERLFLPQTRPCLPVREAQRPAPEAPTDQVLCRSRRRERYP
jgi:hypothetical protein